MTDWHDYFSKTKPPLNNDTAAETIKRFSITHQSNNRNIVLITSGGTTVPLESNTVRFVDNFSQGTRGALSAEYFLKHGYAVIFLHRIRSYEPFSRYLEGQNALDLLELDYDDDNDGNDSGDEDRCRVIVDKKRAPGITKIVRLYKQIKNDGLLLKVGFTTLSDYLFLLRGAAKVLSDYGSNVMFYLAAAVSDFYIPDSEMSEHKIQSSQGGLSLQMTPTPKMLSPLVKEWAKGAFVVSFKLETDTSILSRKAKEALQKYNHQVVIANVLQTRRKTVVLVTSKYEVPVCMTEFELEKGKEIEEKIVAELVKIHAGAIVACKEVES